MTGVGMTIDGVETAYYRLGGRRQMLKVAGEVLTRTEPNRAPRHGLLRGSALNSQADLPTARKYDGKTFLRASQHHDFEAQPEVIHAIGGTVQ